ncbi:MAG: hypothetical protein L0Y38_02105 [Methylococcaceae bacterium]|nr:hypothetical protein [Methylococcaceae bacterium]MCI0732598.1 hypothetical protein [Methylococcaceae bacterium]
MLGSFISGEMWDRFGPIAVFGAASLVCVLAFVIALRWITIDESVAAIHPDQKVIEEEL